MRNSRFEIVFISMIALVITGAILFRGNQNAGALLIAWASAVLTALPYALATLFLGYLLGYLKGKQK